jgi:23S rRNA (cytosine1962-C5)-methyltransferase
MSVAFLKERGLGRIIAGHPWVYESDIQRIENPPADGAEITLRSGKGKYLANGLYSSRSRIPIRIFSRAKEPIDAAFFRKKILAARALREGFAGGQRPSVGRLVWSEADFLPGLILDAYADTLVLQTLTLALDQRKPLLVELLTEIFHPRTIVERNDVPSRALEGMESVKGILAGERPEPRTVPLGAITCEVDVLGGHKTGAYLDQVENQRIVGRLARGRRVLDCFTYQGGFALHAAHGGAASVEGWDISEDAIRIARRNAELNGAGSVRWKTVNVFDELNARQRARETFDLIILDPPSFTRTRAKQAEALRGYKEIHLRALQLLAPGGLLATFCCSHHVDAATFRAVALDAAFDARRILRQRQAFEQAPDHPVIPVIPETEYLKGFLFEVV